MFGLAIDLYDLKANLRVLLAAQTRTWMGVAFVTAAMFSIQYDEVLAPHVTRIAHAWSAATTRITTLSL